MIEFPTVSQELRSLISRRKELHTFLGSVFAGLGILLQNVLQGSLPPGLAESAQLPAPLFTPAIKNDAGHDENIPVAELVNRVGSDLARELERKTLQLYAEASAYAAARGIILADTKVEFGFIDGRLSLIDELLTPDSSRFWDTATYEPGRPQASMDKQPLRDWLEASGWDKQPPGPTLPPDVVAATRARYLTAYERLTGRPLPGTGSVSGIVR